MSQNLGSVLHKLIVKILKLVNSCINFFVQNLQKITLKKIYYLAQILVFLFIALRFFKQSQFNRQQVRIDEKIIAFNKISTRPWLYPEPSSSEIEIKDDHIRFKYNLHHSGISPAFKIIVTSRARFQPVIKIDTLYFEEEVNYEYLFPEQKPIGGISNMLYLHDIDSMNKIVNHVSDSLDIPDSIRPSSYSTVNLRKKVYMHQNMQLLICSLFDTITIDIPKLSSDNILKIIQNNQMFIDIYLCYIYADNDTAFFRCTFGLKYLKQFGNGEYFKKGCLCNWIFIDSSDRPFYIVLEDTTIVWESEYYFRD